MGEEKEQENKASESVVSENKTGERPNETNENALENDQKEEKENDQKEEKKPEQPVEDKPEEQPEENKTEQPVEKEEPKYSKEALLNSGEFIFLDRMILKIEMKDEEKISLQEAKTRIKQFKGED